MSNTPSPGSPTSGPTAAATGGSSKSLCHACTITSQTVATSPANRARTRIGVGEEVVLTVSPGCASWSITSGSGKLNPSWGNLTKVTYTAGDTAGSVTITAQGATCSCTITLEVVEPSHWTMTRKENSKLKHTEGCLECGWQGIAWIQPNDVNFYNIETREVDSLSVATGCYNPSHHGIYHGGYAPPDRASSWEPITRHDATNGSTDNSWDDVYSGFIRDYKLTGTAPPFKEGYYYWPITWQWRVGTGAARNFPVQRQEHQIFATGRCESRKGGHTEFTMYNDRPDSTY